MLIKTEYNAHRYSNKSLSVMGKIFDFISRIEVNF